MKRLYLIGGPMGVGKSTVCRLLKRKLPNSVFLDGDWCWDSDPFQVTEETKAMVTDNIRYLLNSFLHCTAYDNVIFCWVMHEQAIIDGLLSGLDLSDCNAVCISLIAEGETLRQRLKKDIDAGNREPSVLERSLERAPLYGRLDTVHIDTDNRSAEDVCQEIIRLQH